MANIFREPLVLTDGTGVTINLSGQLLHAKSRESVIISIGNDVSVTSNPIFLSLTPSNEQFQNKSVFDKTKCTYWFDKFIG